MGTKKKLIDVVDCSKIPNAQCPTKTFKKCSKGKRPKECKVFQEHYEKKLTEKIERENNRG